MTDKEIYELIERIEDLQPQIGGHNPQWSKDRGWHTVASAGGFGEDVDKYQSRYARDEIAKCVKHNPHEAKIPPELVLWAKRRRTKV